MTEIRPDVAPLLAIDETGILIVVPFPDVAAMTLFRQNFTEIDPENPVPVIVKVPPAPNERVRVESPVIEGGWEVEVSIDVTPLRAIVLPLDGEALG
jgi:hypothetical protein